MLDDEDYGFCGLEGVDAPIVRQVEARTGAVFRPVTLLAAYQVIDHEAGEVARLQELLVGERAERDNIAGLLATTAETLRKVACEFEHLLSDRDQERDRADGLAAERDSLRCRIEELES
jgi:uncharacterized coiled-coil DUF342 family protein